MGLVGDLQIRVGGGGGGAFSFCLTGEASMVAEGGNAAAVLLKELEIKQRAAAAGEAGEHVLPSSLFCTVV